MASYSHNADDFTPLMTSNSAPSPNVASASSEYQLAYYAFDHAVAPVNNKSWIANNVKTGWLKFDFGSGKTVVKYTLSNDAHSLVNRAPKTWTLQGSNNDADWDTLDTQTNVAVWTSQEMRTYDISSPDSYRYYKLDITANQGVTYLTVGELELIGSGDVEITLTDPLETTTDLKSNIQVELVLGALEATSSMSVGELFWGTFVELPSPFAAQSSLQAKTGLEIAVTSLIAQTNLQSNLQIKLVPPAFLAQSELSVGEVFWGYEVELPSAFVANASLQANTQIEFVPSPLIATSTLLSNIGIEVSAGALNATGAILATPVYPIILTGAKRIYLFTLTGEADGVDDIIIPIRSFQSRIKSGDPTYLSVVIPGTEYASAINDRLNGDLVIYMGYQDEDEILLTEIVSRVLFENITIYEGTTNKSITLDGHKTETWMPKTVSLEDASYYNLTKGKLRYRCKPDLYLRPSDTANINDDSFTVESITYSVSAELETYEVAE
jgi:hypothetical protein